MLTSHAGIADPETTAPSGVGSARRRFPFTPGLMALFFVSGFPALLYQVVWQRALFSIFGINIESVTVIVSAFMLGLGLGSMAGGWISKQPRVPLLLVFG